MNADKYYLGIELGSTRIKAVTVDENFLPQSSGSFLWESTLENGIWTYNLDQAWEGLRAAIELLDNRQNIAAMGISGMMHGYLAFDREWNLLTPFRTWQNTCTGPAATVLTQAFHFAIPQRWSIAHLFQAILDKEPHVSRIAHITTLAGYIHYMLTGVNAIGVGDASGMFPIDSQTHTYDAAMMNIFDSLVAGENLPWKLKEILPQVLTAGADAGWLTQEGSARLGGLLPEGIPFAPAEGDAGTGMTATNAVSPRTGNVSAGTSIFSMVVLERPLRRVYQEIDLVTTPSGAPVAMVHCNNCTGDSNAWVGVMQEAARLLGGSAAPGEAYAKLYTKSLEGEPDCGGVLVCNYLAGEGVTHLDAGRPMVIRRPDSRFTLANFFRATLYAALATLKIGMDILKEEQVGIDRLTGHGGLFKTPLVGQRYLAAACETPVTCLDTAPEGGPFGMALLAAYRISREPDETLEAFLAGKVFVNRHGTTIAPDPADVDGFQAYLAQYKVV